MHHVNCSPPPLTVYSLWPNPHHPVTLSDHTLSLLLATPPVTSSPCLLVMWCCTQIQVILVSHCLQEEEARGSEQQLHCAVRSPHSSYWPPVPGAYANWYRHLNRHDNNRDRDIARPPLRWYSAQERLHRQRRLWCGHRSQLGGDQRGPFRRSVSWSYSPISGPVFVCGPRLVAVVTAGSAVCQPWLLLL